MKTKRIIVLMLLPLLLDVLIVSCCDCAPPANFSYTNCSLVIQNIDNSGAQPVISEIGEIPKEAFGMRFEITRKENVCMAKSLPLFSSTAFATSCYCPPDLYHPLDSIVWMKVLTVNNFDSLHLAGTDISAYFKVVNRGYPDIDSFINNSKAVLPYTLDSIFQFDVLLLTPADNNGPHEFKVQVSLSDGRLFEELSPMVNLR